MNKKNVSADIFIQESSCDRKTYPNHKSSPSKKEENNKNAKRFDLCK